MEVTKNPLTVESVLSNMSARGSSLTPEFGPGGTRLIITPKDGAEPDEKAFIAAHAAEFLKAVADIIDVPATAALARKANPKKQRTTLEWIEKFRQSFAAKGVYFEWPEPTLTGRNHPSGHQSLLEVLEELEQEKTPFTLNIPTPYAFEVSVAILDKDDFETEISTFTVKRFAYDQKGCDMLAAKAK